MSTLAAQTPGILLAPARSGRGRRDHLRLVGERERAPRPAASGAATLRLTRRGRLALTSTLALVVALTVALVVSALSPAGASSAVVVEPGMTLTHIAQEYLPEVPLSQAVSDLQRANRLSTTSIAVGQELVIPGR